MGPDLRPRFGPKGGSTFRGASRPPHSRSGGVPAPARYLAQLLFLPLALCFSLLLRRSLLLVSCGSLALPALSLLQHVVQCVLRRYQVACCCRNLPSGWHRRALACSLVRSAAAGPCMRTSYLRCPLALRAGGAYSPSLRVHLALPGVGAEGSRSVCFVLCRSSLRAAPPQSSGIAAQSRAQHASVHVVWRRACVRRECE